MKLIPLETSSRGFINAGCLPYLFMLAFLIGGAQGLYTALKNRNPVETTVEQYIAQRPDAEWVTFKNARLNLLEAAHRERRGKVTEVFIPVRPQGEARTAPVHILLSTKKDDILNALEDIKSSVGKMNESLEAASRHADKLFVTKDVSGLIRFGIHSDQEARDKLENLQMNLATDFVIMNDGEKPELMLSLIMLALGIILALYLARRSAKTAATPPPLPAPNLPPKL